MSAGEASGRSSPFIPAIVVGAALLGFLAFIAYVALGAFEADFRNGDDGGAHALSKSAVGYSGLVTLLNAAGRPALVARGAVAGAASGDGMMILTIDRGDPWTPLLGLSTTRGFSGPVLAVLPKWETVPFGRRGWVRKTGVRDVDAQTWIGSNDPTQRNLSREQRQAAAKRPLIALGHSQGAGRRRLTVLEDGRPVAQVETGDVENFQTFRSAPGWTPLIVDESGATVLAYEQSSERELYALSEPDLLNNHGLSNLDNARAGLFVLNQVTPDGPVFLDVTLNGFERARSMLKLMLQPPFLAATLCAFAAALLMIWRASLRFGAPRRTGRELALGKQALADNQAGLIRMAGREHRMGGRYADVVRGLAASAVSAPRDLAGEALTVFLDRLGAKGRTRESLTDLRAAAEHARNRSELMDAAARLHRWRLEMTRESH